MWKPGVGRAPATGGLGDRGEGPGRAAVCSQSSPGASALRRSCSRLRVRMRDEAGVAGKGV